MIMTRNWHVVLSVFLDDKAVISSWRSFVVVVAYQSSSIIMTEDKAKVAPSYNAVVEFELALVIH